MDSLQMTPPANWQSNDELRMTTLTTIIKMGQGEKLYDAAVKKFKQALLPHIQAELEKQRPRNL